MLFGDVLDNVDTMTNGQLQILQRKVNERWAVLAEQAKQAFVVSDSVRFLDKHGESRRGKVIKICRKNVKVFEGGCVWTIAPSLLKKVQ